MSSEAIFDAIEYDDIDSLEKALEDAGDDLNELINSVDQEGYSPLIVASSIGLVDIAELLIENGAQLDYIAPDHASPLFCAVQEKHWELLAVLTDAKANLNAQRDKGPTPLYIASQEGYHDMVGHLVDVKADPNLHAHGITPLFISCQENHPAVTKLLLEKKADPNKRNKSGGLPVVVAAWRDNVKVLEELVKSSTIKLDKFGGANMSALMTACKNNKLESARILIAAKADLNLKCDSGIRGTAMHYAADKHYLELMNVLKAAGADDGIKNANNHTPADVVMINFDEFLDGYVHTSLNIAADRQLKQLEPEVAPKKDAEPLPQDSDTDSEVEDEEHLVGWSAPKEEAIATKRVDSKAEKEQKNSKESSSKSSKKEKEKEKENAKSPPAKENAKSPSSKSSKEKEKEKEVESKSARGSPKKGGREGKGKESDEEEESKSSSKSPKKERKHKSKKRSKKHKKSKRRSKDDSDEDSNSASDDGDAAAGSATPADAPVAKDVSPEERLAAMLAKNQNKLETIREAFQDHDVDDSGFLDKAEFMACLGSLGLQEQYGRDFRAHVEKCFKAFDKDNNGRISFEEFVQFYNTISTPTRVNPSHTRRQQKTPEERPKAAAGRRKGKGGDEGREARPLSSKRETSFKLPTL
jgi:ankyrin repeat protein